MESDCTYPASMDASFLPSGRYDLGFFGSYQVGLVLGNQMASRGVKAQSRTETSRIMLEGAEVRLVTGNGELFALENNPNPFSAPGAGFVNVGNGSEPGYGVLSVVVIPADDSPTARQALYNAGYLIAEIKAFGHTLGGQAVESNVFKFPIEICYGCLVTFPSKELSAVTGECGVSSDSETAAAPCVWGQDEQVVCTACSGTFEVCSNPVSTL